MSGTRLRDDDDQSGTRLRDDDDQSGTRLRDDDAHGVDDRYVRTPPLPHGRTRPLDTGAPARRGGPGRWLATTALVLLGVGLVVTLLVARFVAGFNPFDRTVVDRTQPAVLLALQDLAEYRAATGEFQVIVDTEETVENLPRQIAGERTLFVAVGTVDAAVDFSALGPESVTVDAERRRAAIRLPRSTLTEATVDPDRSYVFSRERGLLDRLAGLFADSPTDDRRLYQIAERRLERAAADSGLVELADRNTEAMLRSLLGSLGFTDVTVSFR